MENSKILLERALQILRIGQVPKTQWAAGGGTILKEYFGHRLSKDIDIFIDDVQYLSALSSRCNDEATEALDYVETGRYISLTFPEGKIDFIASPPLTPFAHKEAIFLGQHILWEHPIEIVAKKMFFRGEYAIPRDIFDLVVVYHSQYKEQLIQVLCDMSDKLESFYQGFVRQLNQEGYIPYSIANRDMILQNGQAFIGNEFHLCQKLLSKLNPKYSFPSEKDS